MWLCIQVKVCEKDNMSAAHGYDVGSVAVLNKLGSPLDEQQLRRYKCVFCDLLLRDPCQMACGDRSCRVCLPPEYVWPTTYYLIVILCCR